MLNRFYGELKPTAQGPFDPKTECVKYREPPFEVVGANPSDPTEPKKLVLHSIGR